MLNCSWGTSQYAYAYMILQSSNKEKKVEWLEENTSLKASGHTTSLARAEENTHSISCCYKKKFFSSCNPVFTPLNDKCFLNYSKKVSISYT